MLIIPDAKMDARFIRRRPYIDLYDLMLHIRKAESVNTNPNVKQAFKMLADQLEQFERF